MITIWVPADAKVFVNGYETRSTGPQRRYVSRGLQPGYTYRFDIRAQVNRDGQPVEEVRTVYLTAGAREGVAFNLALPGRPEEDLASLR